MHILQISTTAIRLFDESGQELAHQACFARRSSEAWVFAGEASHFSAAVADAEYNAYFAHCDSKDAIQQGGWRGQALDLVYEQLHALALHTDTQGATVLLALASTYNDEQIALLAGVVQEIFTLNAVAKLPLLYARGLSDGRYAILEPELHQLTLTHLDIEDQFASITFASGFKEWGLPSIYDDIYSSICQQFVMEHRYDPGHVTANKVLLLNQLRHTHSDGSITLKVADYTLHTHSQKLLSALPDALTAAIGDREAYLLSQPQLPLHGRLWKGPAALDCPDTTAFLGETLQRELLAAREGGEVAVLIKVAQ